MTYPQAISGLEIQLERAPETQITALARRLIDGAKAYDNYRVGDVIENQDYQGGVQRDFEHAVDYTADNVLGAPWADSAEHPLEAGEKWNAGRRQSLTRQTYDLDERGYPVNPYLQTGVKGRGVIGLFGPNHAVDVGVLSVLKGENGVSSLHAYGIMKGASTAFCGGFAEYTGKDENGYVIGHDVWAEVQAKEFFEEMVSGSITLLPEYADRLDAQYQLEVDTRVAKRNGVPLSEHQAAEIKEQIATGLKLEQVMDQDPGFIERVHELFKDGIECYAGPVRSSTRNTDTSWMETYLSWVYMSDDTWDHLRGDQPVFDYKLAAGDDADDVVAHRIDAKLLEASTGTHSAMFVFMAASYLLEAQGCGMDIDPDVYTQLDDLASYMEAVNIPEHYFDHLL